MYQKIVSFIILIALFFFCVSGLNAEEIEENCIKEQRVEFHEGEFTALDKTTILHAYGLVKAGDEVEILGQTSHIENGRDDIDIEVLRKNRSIAVKAEFESQHLSRGEPFELKIISMADTGIDNFQGVLIRIIKPCAKEKILEKKQEELEAKAKELEKKENAFISAFQEIYAYIEKDKEWKRHQKDKKNNNDYVFLMIFLSFLMSICISSFIMYYFFVKKQKQDLNELLRIQNEKEKKFKKELEKFERQRRESILQVFADANPDDDEFIWPTYAILEIAKIVMGRLESDTLGKCSICKTSGIKGRNLLTHLLGNKICLKSPKSPLGQRNFQKEDYQKVEEHFVKILLAEKIDYDNSRFLELKKKIQGKEMLKKDIIGREEDDTDIKKLTLKDK